jgi:ABC-type nitrate/sulfonate/bicarbonate transport system substrate-binding protein
MKGRKRFFFEKKNQKTFFHLIIAVLATTAARADPIKLEYAYAYANIETTPFYIAQAHGYFAAENLQVDLLALSSGDKIAMALVGGSIQIAAYTPDWVIRVMEKSPDTLKLVFGGSSVPVYSLITGKNIRSYADIKGTRVGVSTLRASDTYLLRRMLAAHGLAADDYEIIATGATPDRAAALSAGAISGTLLASPVDQQFVDKAGLQRLDVSTNTVPKYAWAAHTVRIDWARAHHEALVGFIRAWLRGTNYLYDPANKEEIVALIASTLKIEDRYARISYDAYFGGPVVTVPKDGGIDLVALQITLDAMAAQGDLPTPTPPPSKYIDLQYWLEARDTLK